MTKLAEKIASFVRRLPRPQKAKEPGLKDETSSPVARVCVGERISGGEDLPARMPVGNPEIVITDEFEEGFRRVKDGTPFIFFTGRAGTGKSTFVELLKKRLNSFAVLAPTGVAALNVGGQTIHSFFRFSPGPIDFAKIGRVNNRIGYQALRTLVIDEISMVRVDLLDAIDLMLRKNGPKEKEPFGGVQIVAVGDLFQLPPVVSSEEEAAFLAHSYKSPFFFSARVFEQLRPTCLEFTKVFRQTDEKFVALLNQIREGRGLDEAITLLNERVRAQPAEGGQVIVLTGTNAVADRINRRQLASLGAASRIYEGKITGEFRVEKTKLPAPLELELKEGARVMFVRNDGSKRWVNGTVGTILELDSSTVKVCIQDQWGDRTVRVETETWKNCKYKYNAEEHAVTALEVGSYTQLPLTLAWAVTIHKGQGKTFNNVHIDISGGAFAEGQVYVALSRCRNLEGITLERPIRREDIILNYDVIEFNRGEIGGAG